MTDNICADIVPEDFDYAQFNFFDEKLIYEEKMGRYFDCSLAEEREDFVQNIWDVVCEEYNIHANIFCALKNNSLQVDELIDECCPSYDLHELSIPASVILFNCEPYIYNKYAYWMVEANVDDKLHDLMQNGYIKYNDYKWRFATPEEEKRCKGIYW